MLSLERQEQILNMLSVKKSMSVNALCRELYASPATVRRDLSRMERCGLLQRVRGGAAVLEGSSGELSAFTREGRNTAEKNRIAQLAACYVKDGASLFLDSSSTVGALAPQLARCKGVTVVTNGLRCALVLSEKTSCTVLLPAGRLASRSNSIVGSEAILCLQRYHVDVAFISCAGLSLEQGATDTDAEQAALKATMLARAKKRALLVDSSKLESVFFSHIQGAGEFDLVITDQEAPKNYVNYFSSKNCELVWPEA